MVELAIKRTTKAIQALTKHQGFMRYFVNTSWLFGEKILRMVVGLFDSFVLAMESIYFYIKNNSKLDIKNTSIAIYNNLIAGKKYYEE